MFLNIVIEFRPSWNFWNCDRILCFSQSQLMFLHNFWIMISRLSHGLLDWQIFKRYIHKTSNCITSSYKTSSNKTSIYQTSNSRMSRLQNVQVTKRPFYKTSRTQKRPVFEHLKACLKKPFSQNMSEIAYFMRSMPWDPRGAKLWLN